MPLVKNLKRLWESRNQLGLAASLLSTPALKKGNQENLQGKGDILGFTLPVGITVE